MANHRRKHTSRKHRGCAMCKPHKVRGQKSLLPRDARRLQGDG